MRRFTVTFICLGNICRSACAETVFKKKLVQADLHHYLAVDSAGTSAYHEGEEADQRMKDHAEKRSYYIRSISRGVNQYDIVHSDMIICMDNQNIYDLDPLLYDSTDKNRIFKMTDFCTKMDVDHVPDPYYGGYDGFENVLDIIEDACDGLLEVVRKKLGKAAE